MLCFARYYPFRRANTGRFLVPDALESTSDNATRSQNHLVTVYGTCMSKMDMNALLWGFRLVLLALG